MWKIEYCTLKKIINLNIGKGGIIEMNGRIFLGFLVFLVLFLICFLSSFAYYFPFLSPESNFALEALKEKCREKEIVLEKEHGFVWVVILPKNDGIKTNEVKEEIEGHIYTITEITITNPQGWTKVIWGSAAKFHKYDMPRICVRFDS
jgi:hypothetical protein